VARPRLSAGIAARLLDSAAGDDLARGTSVDACKFVLVGGCPASGPEVLVDMFGTPVDLGVSSELGRPGR